MLTAIRPRYPPHSRSESALVEPDVPGPLERLGTNVLPADVHSDAIRADRSDARALTCSAAAPPTTAAESSDRRACRRRVAAEIPLPAVETRIARQGLRADFLPGHRVGDRDLRIAHPGILQIEGDRRALRSILAGPPLVAGNLRCDPIVTLPRDSVARREQGGLAREHLRRHVLQRTDV